MFKYGYAVHTDGRGLKQRNILRYYVSKRLLFRLIIGMILLPGFL